MGVIGSTVELAAFTLAASTKEVMVVLDYFWLEFFVEFSLSFRGAKIVRKEAVRSGMNIMSDVTKRNTLKNQRIDLQPF